MTATPGRQKHIQQGPQAGGSRQSSRYALQVPANDGQDILEEPVPLNGKKRLPTDYILALWEYQPFLKGQSPQIGWRIQLKLGEWAEAGEKRRLMWPECSSSRVYMVRAPMGPHSSRTEYSRTKLPLGWMYGGINHLRRNCQRGYRSKTIDRDRKNKQKKLRKKVNVSSFVPSVTHSACRKSKAMTVCTARDR